MSDRKLKIIFEDNDLLVLDKEAGVSTHPADGESDKALSEMAAEYLKSEDTSGISLVVHRLDKGTSGVILLAKNPETAAKLRAQFKSREVHKTYIALVSGSLETDSGKIDIPLARNTRIRGRFDPKSEGKSAITEFSVKHRYQDFTLVEAYPKSGRTHQIRTHFSAIGHPLAGDKRYGYKGVSMPRIFLHAAKIEFVHPGLGEQVSYHSDLPDSLVKVLSSLSD